MTYKLDIFWLLNELNKDPAVDIFGQLTTEQVASFSPLVTMRWLSGTSDDRQIIMLNEVVNLYVFKLGEHKELLMKLLQTASSKVPKRYAWLPVKSSKKDSKRVQVISDFFEISTSEAREYIVPDDEVINYATELGWQPSDIKDLKKELGLK
jgi:hypothetical protein